jgi:hypothetical protein
VRYLHLAVLCAFFTACASTRIEPRSGQNVIYSNGQATVCSKRPASFAAVQPLGTDADGRLAFRVAVYNTGSSPFNFGVENISLTDATQKPVHVYTRHEVERHARVKAAWQAVAVGLNAAGAAYLAAQPATTYYSGHFHGQTVGGNFHSQTIGSFHGVSTTYNPAASVAAQQAVQTNAILEGQLIGNQLSAELAGAQAVLGTTTVFPRTWCTGLVLTPKRSQANFVLRAGSDSHLAGFDVQ